MLYPLKFKPLYKQRIWGGQLLSDMGKKLPEGEKIGESWEISGVEGDVSVVRNGALKGNSLQELIEIYMDEMVGEKCFAKYSTEFPILIKLIDAQDNLSIQVHPCDQLAKERHNAYGKTEMWYVVDHEPGAQLMVGFNRKVDKELYKQYLEQGRLDDLLTKYEVHKGDTFFIPAGTIHAIGKGILVAEIQQTSDITYRVFDYNRVDKDGNHRELHTELALDAIDFSEGGKYLIKMDPETNESVNLVHCDYFDTNLLKVSGTAEKRFEIFDTFVTYVCLDGKLKVKWEGGEESLSRGESMLIPASITHWSLEGEGTLLESYLPLDF